MEYFQVLAETSPNVVEMEKVQVHIKYLILEQWHVAKTAALEPLEPAMPSRQHHQCHHLDMENNYHVKMTNDEVMLTKNV